jgi:hypothetical protein
MAISDALEEELGLFQRLIAKQAPRNLEHNEDSKSRVEEVVSLGLFVIAQIREHDPARSETERPKDLSLKPDAEERVYLVRLYETWLSETRKLIERIDSLETSGIVVNRGDELIQAFHDVVLTAIDPEGVKQSMKDAMEGRVKPLREAADEFRRRRYGRSA